MSTSETRVPSFYSSWAWMLQSKFEYIEKTVKKIFALRFHRRNCWKLRPSSIPIQDGPLSLLPIEFLTSEKSLHGAPSALPTIEVWPPWLLFCRLLYLELLLYICLGNVLVPLSSPFFFPPYMARLCLSPLALLKMNWKRALLPLVKPFWNMGSTE